MQPILKQIRIKMFIPCGCGMKLLDLEQMPNFNPSVKNGCRSVSEGKIYWTDDNLVTCHKHGACLCVNEMRTIWRCPACHEGAYVDWEK